MMLFDAAIKLLIANWSLMVFDGMRMFLYATVSHDDTTVPTNPALQSDENWPVTVSITPRKIPLV